MSAPSPRMEAAGQPAADALQDVFKALAPAEMQKHEAVLAYWLSIRGNRELPPLRDLDPLEISDAAPHSVLLELIGGGEDAEVRHVGENLKDGDHLDRISQAARPSILSSIARKLSIVAISRNFLAFEDEFSANGSTTRCWITLLPLSAAGAWVDYVYGYVSVETEAGEATKKQKKAPAVEEAEVEESAARAEDALDEPVEVEAAVVEVETAVVEVETAVEADAAVVPPEEDVLELDTPAEELAEEIVDELAPAEDALDEVVEVADVAEDQPAAGVPETQPAPVAKKSAGFSFNTVAAASGFYGTQAVKVEPVMPTTKAKAKVETPVAEAPAPSPVEEATSAIEETAPSLAEEAPPLAEEAPASVEDEPAPVAAAEELAPVSEDHLEVVADEESRKTSSASEGTLQSKLTEVRAKADEARMAKLRANAALYEGLSAAYDFALEAEDSPEEYLRIVEGAGLKIQLRSPMRPVVKLAFEDMCDDATIAQLEKVLAWAIDQDLPRGTLAQRIEEAGGIGPILSGTAKAA